MADNLDWTSDPLVQLENAILPVLCQAHAMICDGLISTHASDHSSRLNIFDAAVHMLQTDAANMLVARGIRADPAALQPLKQAAKEVIEMRNALQSALFAPLSTANASSLLTQVTTQMSPALDDALNTFRKIFIGHVLTQQHAHALQAKEAIGRLDKISKQIFFISINASVEAARVGDAGRGFTQISSDIRALSQSAQDATRSLSDLVQNG